MHFSTLSCPKLGMGLFLLCCTLQQAFAYRPVQHCKTLGDNGHYSGCAAITQFYNTTTGQSDMYIRYHWFRYRNSKNGWHAFALGQKMDGALMLIMYGDPNTPSLPMTVDVRTAGGHAPPRLVSEVPLYATGAPVVEVVTANFEEYKGDVKIEKLDEKPTHVGIMEAIIRGYEKWTGATLSNTSTALPMLWSSNWKQNMNDDFSHGRNIDMHAFGAGFGFLRVDLLNAETPEPMFGPLNELGGIIGAGEIRVPEPPTAAELANGEDYIAKQRSGSGSSDAGTGSTPSTSQNGDGQSSGGAPPQSQPVQQPARTILGKTLRDWMWHLHGLMMTLAFLALYPFGTYLIRSGSSTAFNLHWTVQALATVAMFIGSVIGYINSYGISVKHQFIGIGLVGAIIAQILLGWRHHVQFVATKRKGWLSKTHIILGRIILPVGFVNVIMGMLLRQYGWFTISLVVVLIVLEGSFLIFILTKASEKRSAQSELRPSQTRAQENDEAEEFFQLGGEDDFSDSDGEQEENRAVKDQERQKQAERLRRLDRV